MANVDGIYFALSIYEGGPPGEDLPDPEPDEPPGQGVMMVYDMRNPTAQPASPADEMGQWYAWRPPGDAMGAVVHQGVHYYIDSDGSVRYEVEGQRFDDTETPILTKVHLAPLSLADLQGAERVFRGQVNGVGAGAATMKLTTEIVKERGTSSVVVPRQFSMDETMGEFEFLPARGRMTSIEITLEEVAGEDLTEGHQIKSIGLEVGISGQLRRVSTRQRI